MYGKECHPGIKSSETAKYLRITLMLKENALDPPQKKWVSVVKIPIFHFKNAFILKSLACIYSPVFFN